MTNRSDVDTRQGRNWFLVLSAGMLVLFALSWPIERSLDLWVFKDRGDLLNLDYMLDAHLRLGVDAYYSYGLLPVLVQHTLFAAFGRGPWPVMATHLAYILLTAGAWAMIVRAMPNPRFWFIGVLALCPILIWVNPNLPYVPVLLSMLFAIAYVLQRRYATALVAAAFGCWSVPSVNLLFAGLLFIFIVLDWYAMPQRRWQDLARNAAPGALAYLLMGVALAAYFGWAPVLATALPLAGAKFYHTINYGLFTTLREFLYPGPDRFLHGSWLRYYICDRATWWVFSTVLLSVFAAGGLWRMWQSRRVEPPALAVVLCAATQLAFTFLAYGEAVQHIIYDPIVVAGVVVGLAHIRPGNLRKVLAVSFVGLGLLGSINQAAYTYWKWRREVPFVQAQGLYATPDFAARWMRVLALADGGHSVFFLSYGTGVHHYFPQLHSPLVWTLQVAQQFDADRARILDGLQNSDFVVEDLTGPTRLFSWDESIHRQLASLCRIDANDYFVVWARTRELSPTGECLP